MTVPIPLRALAARLWLASPPLAVLSALMLPALALAAAGLVFDTRLITGAPAWLKPAKFALSIAVYALTLAWLFTFLPDRPRLRRFVGWTTAVTLLLEIVIIDVQAWRGVASHFNTGTRLDAVLFTLMGAAIVVQTVVSVGVAVALWRHAFADRALAWALRLGMSLTIAGAMTGGLMTAPTAEQLARARATGQMPVAGAHTVGAPDGGPGVPVTRWSRQHGDLRVPHFVGLHALQAFALIVFALPRRWGDAKRVRVALTAFAGYSTLFALLLTQALAGQSLLAPDGAMLALLVGWAVLTGAALLAAVRVGRIERMALARGVPYAERAWPIRSSGRSASRTSSARSIPSSRGARSRT
jgi:hypothetical protein